MAILEGLLLIWLFLFEIKSPKTGRLFLFFLLPYTKEYNYITIYNYHKINYLSKK
jgi:Na+/proline symporter